MKPNTTSQSLRDDMYGDFDLSSLEVFSGNFINYGYWAEVDYASPLSEADRTRSQADLYRQVVDRLGVSSNGSLLEVGCGLGVGARIVLSEYEPRYVCGLDLSPAQLHRAAMLNAEVLSDGNFALQQGSALDMPFSSDTFDGIYSVEAAQHFDDVSRFAMELYRVLRPGGRAVLATFFAPDDARDSELVDLIETVSTGVDKVRAIGDVTADLHNAGFAAVNVESIGEQVWAGLDAWIAATVYRDTWSRNWLRCYKNGWIDYFLITVSKA